MFILFWGEVQSCLIICFTKLTSKSSLECKCSISVLASQHRCTNSVLCSILDLRESIPDLSRLRVLMFWIASPQHLLSKFWILWPEDGRLCSVKPWPLIHNSKGSLRQVLRVQQRGATVWYTFVSPSCSPSLMSRVLHLSSTKPSTHLTLELHMCISTVPPPR